MPTQISIREDIQSDALEVILEGADVPFAKEREQPAFHSGGPVERKLVFLPGDNDPTIQVQQARERPWVISGAFRDHQFVRDGGPEGIRHAREMRDAIEEIRYRCNPLVITWDDQERKAFLQDADFGEESERAITYELTFDITKPPTRPERTESQDRVEPAPSTIAEQLRDELAERRAQWEALRSQGADTATVDTVVEGLDTCDLAAVSSQNAAVALEQSSTPAERMAAMGPITAASSAGQAAIASLQTALAAMKTTVIPAGRTEGFIALWSAQFGTANTLLSVANGFRNINLAARQRARIGTRLYQVRPDDTLEGIARMMLGDGSRARDLGIRADQLSPGRIIRIPQN